jgi:hypothetical protein
MDICYSSPIEGYDVIGELDEDDLCYEWHTLHVLVQRASGRLFWIEDSGCSCNGPFDDRDEGDLAPVGDGQFVQAVRDFPAKPDEKIPFYALASRSFGANVYVTSSEVILS